jgi:hypothetical protein
MRNPDPVVFRTRSVATFFFTLTMLVLVCFAEGALGRAFRMLMRARAEVRAVATGREPSRWRSRVISRIGLALAILVAAFSIVGNGPTMASPEWAVRFTASPELGPAPLTVAFCAAAGIAIDFGDGTSSGMQMSSPGDCPPGLANYASHTYREPGAYRLRGVPCPSSALHPECGQAAEQANSVTITVTPS